MAGIQQKMRILPIASGKGGVGKTLFTANLGIMLSRMNQKVVLLDADLGASNLHTALGMPYLPKTLNDLLTGDATQLSQVMVKTEIPNLYLLGGSRHLPAYPDYKAGLTRKIIESISSLDADILLIDLGGAITPDILDLFLLSDEGIMITTNDPSAIQNTYQFLKMAVFRKILKAFPNNTLISFMVHSATHVRSRDKISSVPELLDKLSHVDRYYRDVIQSLLLAFTPRLVVNKVDKSEDVRAATVISTVSNKFSGITPTLIGTIEYDQGIRESTHRLRPFTLDRENLRATEQVNLIAGRILEGAAANRPAEESVPFVLEEGGISMTEKREVWFMDNIQYHNKPLHILTEKLSRDGSVQTSVYSKGKILFTKKLHYPEMSDHQSNEKTQQQIVRKQHLTAIKGIQVGRIAFNDFE
jgi:flagellar biosynthesis protein FlhG